MGKTAHKLVLVWVGLTDKQEVPKPFPKGNVGKVALPHPPVSKPPSGCPRQIQTQTLFRTNAYGVLGSVSVSFIVTGY